MGTDSELCTCGHPRWQHFDNRNPDMGDYQQRSWCEKPSCQCKKFYREITVGDIKDLTFREGRR